VSLHSIKRKIETKKGLKDKRHTIIMNFPQDVFAEILSFVPHHRPQPVALREEIESFNHVEYYREEILGETGETWCHYRIYRTDDDDDEGERLIDEYPLRQFWIPGQRTEYSLYNRYRVHFAQTTTYREPISHTIVDHAIALGISHPQDVFQAEFTSLTRLHQARDALAAYQQRRLLTTASSF